MRWVVAAIVLAGCGQSDGEARDEAKELVSRRRIALGLPETPLSFKKAMQELHSLDAEGELERETDPEKLRELALRIENLLIRAEGELATEAAASVNLARALAHRPGLEMAARLQKTCTECHVTHRKER